MPCSKPGTQRRHPNGLWQCDLKLIDDRWLITILDDRSRFVTASHIFKGGTAENVIWLLDHAIHEYAKPREILTDHGSHHGAYERANPVSTPAVKAADQAYRRRYLQAHNAPEDRTVVHNLRP